MNDRNNVVNEIENALGKDGSKELAERMFDAMRSDGRIYWDEYTGLTIQGGIDLLAVAVEVSS